MPLTPTPNPTIDEIAEDASLVIGDVSAAMDELVLRLQQLLPGYYGRKNQQKGWTGAKAIPPLKASDIQIAPADLADKHIGQVLVEAYVTMTPEGIGGAFRNQGTVTISSIDARIQAGQQVRVNYARAEAVIEVLFQFLSGCVNAQGQQVWKSLVPTGYQPLQGDWAKEYSGSSVTLTLMQPPMYSADFEEDD